MPDTPKANMDFLHKQVGPLPVGGWLLVVAAGLGFSWWRKRQAGTSTNTPNDGIQPAFTDETVGNLFGLIGALNKGSTGVPTQAITDNTTWYQSAVRELLGHGFVPGLVDTALRKYMQGMSLSTAEQAIIERALQLVGPLPSPPPPPTTTGDGNKVLVTAGSANPFLEPVTGQKNMIPLYGAPTAGVTGAPMIGLIPFGTSLEATGHSISQLWGSMFGSTNTQNTLIPVSYQGKAGYVATTDLSEDFAGV